MSKLSEFLSRAPMPPAPIVERCKRGHVKWSPDLVEWCKAAWLAGWKKPWIAVAIGVKLTTVVSLVERDTFPRRNIRRIGRDSQPVSYHHVDPAPDAAFNAEARLHKPPIFVASKDMRLGSVRVGLPARRTSKCQWPMTGRINGPVCGCRTLAGDYCADHVAIAYPQCAQAKEAVHVQS